MVRIVDDLLDVSRITQGKVELRKEPVALADLANAAVEFCRPAIAAARHTLTVSLPDEVVTLDADPVRLTQVLVNLLNNAAKFTPPGGHIWLIAETSGEQPDHHDQLTIRVRDTGIGIAGDLLPKIFDLFMQGDLSLERSRAGLGVGLTLARNLVALHGGTVDVSSEGSGYGSEFTVHLPLDPGAQPEAIVSPPVDATGGSRLRILIADDNEDGRQMLGYLLSGDGHDVAEAADGPATLAAAERFHPDVVILDIGMPGMSGYVVAERLRAAASESSPVLVALSGLGQEEDKARAAHVGFDRHFTKPVDVKALRAFLDGLTAAPRLP
jgi:CheY-like chemotaxis protein